MNLKDEILAEMKKQGWTQRRLAQAIGMTEPRVSNWLRGKLETGATEETVAAAMKALGMRVVGPEVPPVPKKPRKPKG